MAGFQNISTLPDNPTFSQMDNKYDVPLFKRICHKFGVDPSSDFCYTCGTNHGLGLFTFGSHTPDPQKRNRITPGSARLVTKLELPKREPHLFYPAG